MRLSSQQKQAVTCKASALVEACPGSGKTRTLIAKLFDCIERLSETPRKVACITYTNAAVHEIEYRIRANGISDNEGVYDVSTIHVFCLNHILRPFAWKLDGFDIDFKILSPDSERYSEVMTDLATRYGLDTWAQEAFERINYNTDGTLLLPDNVPLEAAHEYKEALKAEGFLDFSSLIYYSFLLVRDFPEVARSISAKFAYILIDEFQDTSLLQTEIFSSVFDQQRTHFFLVGDPEQSIYGFAGASPDLMEGFASYISAERFSLSGNYRSNASVIQCAENLISRTPEMYQANPEIPETIPPQSVGERDNFTAIKDHFLPALDQHGIPYGNAAVLGYSWYVLFNLGKQLRRLGIPVMGPGARPYKRSHIFGRLIEPICEYLEHQDNSMIKRIEKELFFLISNVTGRATNRIFSYEGRKVVYKMIYEARNFLEKGDGLSAWLTDTADAISDILIEAELVSNGDRNLLGASSRLMLEDIESNSELGSLTAADLGVFANPKHCLKLTTMHRSKGREFDAVAIISADEEKIPFYNYFNPLTDDKLAESQRLFYVSVTRAQKLLMVFSDPYNSSRFISAFHD